MCPRDSNTALLTFFYGDGHDNTRYVCIETCCIVSKDWFPSEFYRGTKRGGFFCADNRSIGATIEYVLPRLHFSGFNRRNATAITTQF